MSATNQSVRAIADRMIGRKIGHYRITRRIGQGGMGVVYEAAHDKIKQRVAVKVLHHELSEDEKVVQRFFNEADAISRAQHSSIVKIMDYGQLEDATAYIMMEFLDGEPLVTRIERAQEQGTSLGLHMVVALGHQIAMALNLIHDKSIVHRDQSQISKVCFHVGRKRPQRPRNEPCPLTTAAPPRNATIETH